MKSQLTINLLCIFLFFLIIIFGYIVIRTNNNNNNEYFGWFSRLAHKAAKVANSAKKVASRSLNIGDKLSHRIQKMTAPGSALAKLAAMNPAAKKMLNEAHEDATIARDDV